MKARRLFGLLAGAAVIGLAGAAAAQEIPAGKDQVAHPDGTLPGEPEIALVQVAEGFNDPVNVTSAYDGSGRLFVVERAGRIRIVNGEGEVNGEPFLDLTQVNPLGSIVQTQFVEQGLFSVAFHPDFAQNGYFYVHYSSLPFNGDGMIVRITADPDSPDVVSPEQVNDTLKVIMRVEQPYYNHNGGDIMFGPDGYLYITSGDGGWEGDVLQVGQDTSTLLGKILRIDVDVDEGELLPYRIPDDNPFRDMVAEREMVLFGITEEGFAQIRPEAKPEILHWGVRNPYKIAFDPETDDLWIADVGQNHWEMINWAPAGEVGLNYGWPTRGGTQCHPLTGPDDECELIGALPVSEYPHEEPYPGGSTELPTGCSVQGFGVARYGGMDGVFLAGDWCSGRVFGTGWDDEAGEWVMQELLQTDLQFTAGGRDEDGTILAVNCNCFYLADQGPDENPPGALWRIVPAGEVPDDAVVARTLN
ncbi:PQQ-dependent sugar dehydrogenase [soil metagenome]